MLNYDLTCLLSKSKSIYDKTRFDILNLLLKIKIKYRKLKTLISFLIYILFGLNNNC